MPVINRVFVCNVHDVINFAYLQVEEGVPVCSGFCDEWYEACKEDQICVENVLMDYNFTKHEENYCPVNSSCKSYQAMYGNGKNLCEKMWGESYKYTLPDAEYSNCLTMDPSKKVKGIGITSVPNISLLALILFIMALMQQFVCYSSLFRNKFFFD